MEYIKKYQSPIGNITMASDGESLIGLWFEDDKYYADILKEPVEQDLPVFDQTIAWLNLYFDGIVPNFCPPIKMQGTPFQRMIWTIIQHILMVKQSLMVILRKLSQNMVTRKKCQHRQLVVLLVIIILR